MLGLLAPTLIAFGAALAVGGSPRRLIDSRIRGWPAIVACFALELLLYNPPIDAQPWAMQVGPWMWLATRLVFLGVLILNGWPAANALAWPYWLAALGLGLNTLVIAANGGHMPQSTDAAIAVWGASHIDPGKLQNVAPVATVTRLAWLGDVFAEPAWLPRRNVISIGDIWLALGVAGWVFSRTISFTNMDRYGKRNVKIVFRQATPIYGVARSRGRT
jgi:hypothetical protein